MFATLGASPRRFLFSGLAIAGCLALLLFAAGLVRAEQVVASWYGPGFEGATTASGEPFDPSDYTAAHKTLPFGTKLIVTHGGRSVVVRVNDRGPYVAGRDLDLSQAAAESIGLTAVGVATVEVENADPATPTGPYPGGAPATSSANPQTPPSVSPAPEEAAPPEARGAAEQQYRGQERPRLAGRGADEDQYATQDKPAAEDQYAEPSVEPTPEPNPVKDQYQEPSVEPTPEPSTVEDQYAAPGAAANQYTEPGAAADQYAEENPAPRGAPTLVQPPAPRPADLEAPPAELVTPGSTVELRIRLGTAAPPPGYTGPLPGDSIPVEQRDQGPEHAAQPAVKTEASVAVLPETGGASFGALIGGCLLIGLGTCLLGRIYR